MSATLVTHRSTGRVGRRPAGRFIVLALLIVGAAAFFVPFFLVGINAFKSPAEYAISGPLGLPSQLQIDSIVDFWQRTNFDQKLWNSLVISTTVAVGAVALSLLNAFALGIGRVRGRNWLLVIFLMGNLLPQEALAYPLYYLARAVGVYDTAIPVIIIFIVIHSAFGTYLLTSVLAHFPSEILEAARVDGAGKWRQLVQVVAPISMPTLMVLFVFFFIWTWNEFFLPLIFLASSANQTVPVALGVLQGQHLTDATTSSAASLLGVLPAIIFFLVFQRTLVRGITAGAVK